MTGAHAQHDGSQQRRWLVLVAMTGSLAMIFVDMTVVGVALPKIGGALGMGDAGQAWLPADAGVADGARRSHR
jgi:hypothetical protein